MERTLEIIAESISAPLCVLMDVAAVVIHLAMLYDAVTSARCSTVNTLEEQYKSSDKALLSTMMIHLYYILRYRLDGYDTVYSENKFFLFLSISGVATLLILCCYVTTN